MIESVAKIIADIIVGERNQCVAEIEPQTVYLHALLSMIRLVSAKPM